MFKKRLPSKTVLLSTITIALSVLTLSGCQDDADVASYNLSKAADNFEIVRRVVFYNGITGDYILSVQGLCSVADSGQSLIADIKWHLPAKQILVNM